MLKGSAANNFNLVKIYCCQLDIAWEDKHTNFQRVSDLLDNQDVLPGSLVILPEMFASGYSQNADAIAEVAGGPTQVFLANLAREKGVYLLGGLVRMNPQGRLRNEAICLNPSGQRISSYAKLHLFSPPDQIRHYVPGARLSLFHWGEVKVAVFICQDLHFPEIFRMAVKRGASVLVVIANWPGKNQSHWTALLRARAIENQAYAIGVNRCGMDPQQDCYGGSLVVDPLGALVAEAGGAEALIAVDLEIKAMNKLRQDFPVLRDMRTQFALKNPAGSLALRRPVVRFLSKKTGARISPRCPFAESLAGSPTDYLGVNPGSLAPVSTLNVPGKGAGINLFRPQNNSQ